MKFIKNQTFKNFLSLGGAQFFNGIVPIIITPYLVFKLGVENFGLVAISQALINYFISISDYGFSVTGVQKIVLVNDKKQLGSLFFEVMATKFLLTIVSLIVLIGIILIVPSFSSHQKLYFATLCLLIGQSFLPYWFLQGVQKNHLITLLTFSSRIIYILLIFLAIRKPDDYIYVNFLSGISHLLVAIVGIIYIKFKFKFKFKTLSISTLKNEIIAGWSIFLTNLSISININTNIVVLGFFASSLYIGYYSIVEKIIFIFRQLIAVFFQATFAESCKIAISEGHKALINFFTKFYIPFFLFILISCLSLLCLTDFIFSFFSLAYLRVVKNIFKLSLLIPIIVSLNVPFYQTLVSYNKKKSYTRAYFYASLSNIIFNLILVPLFSVMGTVMCIILTEAVLTLSLIIFTEKKEKAISLKVLFTKNNFKKSFILLLNR